MNSDLINYKHEKDNVSQENKADKNRLMYNLENN